MFVDKWGNVVYIAHLKQMIDDKSYNGQQRAKIRLFEKMEAYPTSLTHGFIYRVLLDIPRRSCDRNGGWQT